VINQIVTVTYILLNTKFIIDANFYLYFSFVESHANAIIMICQQALIGIFIKMHYIVTTILIET